MTDSHNKEIREKKYVRFTCGFGSEQRVIFEQDTQNMYCAHEYFFDHGNEMDGLIIIWLKERHRYYERHFIPVLKRHVSYFGEKVDQDEVFDSAKNNELIWIECVNIPYCTNVLKTSFFDKFNHVHIHYRYQKVKRTYSAFVARTYTDRMFQKTFNLYKKIEE